MAQLGTWLSNRIYSKHWIYIFILAGVIYFTSNRSELSEQRPGFSKTFSDMREIYPSEDIIPSGGYDNDGVHEGKAQVHTLAHPPSSLIEQGAVVESPAFRLSQESEPESEDAYEGFHSSHRDPIQLENNAQSYTMTGESRDIDSQSYDSREEEQSISEVVQQSRDPSLTNEHILQKTQHSKHLHFPSSHHAQVGRDHVISDDQHGDFVPHTYVSKSSSHGAQDPYYSMHVRELELERMKTRLPRTLSNYRNPCWVEHLPRGFSYFEHTLYYQYYKYYPNVQPHRDWEKTYDKLDHLIQVRKKKTKDGKSWRLRCFPYFFLIGFTRSGTTDLWRSMSLLPEFVRGLIKETKFWSKIRLHNYADSLPNATLSDYLDLYDGVSEVIRGFSRRMSDGTYYHPGITADMDPATIWKLPKWQHIKGNDDRDAPRITTADHLHALVPDTKLIVMMRDPVERAFSHYCFFKTKKNFSKIELADRFHHDMVRATAKLIRCFKQRGTKSCAYQPPRYSTLAMRSLTCGMYNVFINDWLKPFNRQQFLFIQSEDYFQNRVKVIKEVSHFLGIDDSIPNELVESIKEFKVMNPSKKTGMHKETRELLREFFRPFNKKLATLLKQDRYNWDY